MPYNEFFTVRVIVGNNLALEEYIHKGKCYVDSSVITDQSYKMMVEEDGCDEQQELVVTPYKVQIAAHWDAPTCFYSVYIDGVKVATPLLHAGKTRYIPAAWNGAQLSESLASQIGEIQVYCLEGIYVGVVDRVIHSRRIPCPYDQETSVTQLRAENKNFLLAGATKKDTCKAGEGMIMATRQGRSLFSFEPFKRKTEQMWYDRGPILDIVQIYYRPRATLRSFGLVLPETMEEKELVRSEEKMETDPPASLTPDVKKTKKLGRYSMSGNLPPDVTLDAQPPVVAGSSETAATTSSKLGRYSMGGGDFPGIGADSLDNASDGPSFTSIQRKGKLGRYSMGGGPNPNEGMGDNTASACTRPKLGRFSMGGGTIPEEPELKNTVRGAAAAMQITPDKGQVNTGKLGLFSPSDDAKDIKDVKERSVPAPDAKTHQLKFEECCKLSTCDDELDYFDDDICWVEDADSSVEFLGDDDCYVVDAAKNDNTVIDLLNDTLMNTSIKS